MLLRSDSHTGCVRIKDRKGLVVAEYLHVETSTIDRSIQRLLAIATAELAIGAAGDDLASGSDGEQGGEGSGSESE